MNWRPPPTHSQVGVTTEVGVLDGHTPDALLAGIAHQQPDLIMMTTHLDSGRRHAVLDGVAEAVVAAGRAPVLLLRPDAESPFRSRLGQKVLVLLDGSRGLDVQLAWDASFDVKEAEAYLRLTTKRLHRRSPDTAIQTQVQVGELVQEVRAFESAGNIGLIVMATHGRSRLAEALRGSTVHDVLNATACPLVIVHPRRESPD